MTVRKRRFSITEAQASAVCVALRLAINELRQAEPPTPYRKLTIAEMEELLNKIGNYNFHKEDERK